MPFGMGAHVPDAATIDGNRPVAVLISLSLCQGVVLPPGGGLHWEVTGSGNSPADPADFGGAFPFGNVSYGPGANGTVLFYDSWVFANGALWVNVSGDVDPEGDQGFTVTLSNISSPTGAMLGNVTASGIIREDDATVVPLVTNTSISIDATNVSHPEGNSGVSDFFFTVTRSGDTTGTSSVQYAVSGSGVHPADASDFHLGVLPSGIVTFTPGQTSSSIMFAVDPDLVQEYDENFTVTLSNPTGAVLANATGGATILNDDTAALLDDYPESTSTTGYLSIGGSITGNIDAVGDVDWFSANLSAGVIYQFDLRGVSSSAGTLPDPVINSIYDSSGAIIPGTWNDDGGNGYDSRLNFTPSSSGHYYIAACGFGVNVGTYTLGLTDVSHAVTAATLSLAATDAVLNEGNAGVTEFTFTVIRTGDTTGSSSVHWAVSGSGTNPADLADFGGIFPSDMLSFAPGQTSTTITVQVSGDVDFESDNGFTVTLSHPQGATLGISTTSTSIQDTASGGYGLA